MPLWKRACLFSMLLRRLGIMGHSYSSWYAMGNLHQTIPPGTRFFNLEILSLSHQDSRGIFFYSAVCDCGKLILVQAHKLRAGRTKSCGCRRKRQLQGFRFKTFTVIKREGNTVQRNSTWLCQCQCGYQAIFSTKTIDRHFGQESNPNAFACPNCTIPKKQRKAELNIIWNGYHSQAKSRGLSWELSLEVFEQLIYSNCHYCGTAPGVRTVGVRRWKRPVKANGIDRKNNELGYTNKNSVSCCATCNRVKGVLSDFEFIELCIQVVEHQKKTMTLGDKICQ